MFRSIAPRAAPAAILGGVLVLGFSAAPAHAQLARTFISAATGNDANDCSRATPCRTFQGAHDKTFDQGEVTVLDPGGYGAVTIAKSISIVNDGVGEAGVSVSGGATGITINAPAAAYVNLRGITIQGIGFGGGKGLQFNSGFALTITNCVFRNLTSNGVEVVANGPANLAMSNTLVGDNGGNGVSVRTGPSGNLKASFSRVESYNNSDNGFLLANDAGGPINATVEDSVAAGNKNSGVRINGGSGNPAHLVVARSVTANNSTGLFAGVGAFLRVGQSVITGNTVTLVGFGIGAGLVSSFGDNYIAGNADGDPTPSQIAKK